MRHYRNNAKWLTWFAPFRALSISAAYLTPFFLEKGLNLSENISATVGLFGCRHCLGIPSGMIADRFGRARAIKLSAPIAAVAMIAYGFSNSYWQFMVCELALALSNGLISGIDTALLIDSLKAEDQEEHYVKISQRINAFGYSANRTRRTVGNCARSLCQHWLNSRCRRVLTLVGAYFVWHLVEAPRFDGSQEAERISAWTATKQLARKPEVRWLVVLSTSLSTATYLAFWLSTSYYLRLGIPVVLFGAILAARNLWKALLSHLFHKEQHMHQKMLLYATLAGSTYLGMASGQLWASLDSARA